MERQGFDGGNMGLSFGETGIPHREYRLIYPSKEGNLDFHGQDSTIQTGVFFCLW